MPVRKQISVLIPNKPGTLAKLSQTLADQKINIEALTIHDITDYGFVRLLPSDVDKACAALCDAGYHCQTEDVVVTEVANRPGTLAEAASKLANARINIDYTYFSATGRNSLVVFKVNNPRKAAQLLGG